MEREKQIIEEILNDIRNHCTKEKHCGAIDCAECLAEYLTAKSYRKERQGKWVKKHRHRGGFRTVTVTDSFGEKHTGTVDNRYEYDELYCSVCGKIAHDAFLNYCANCGVKMKGAE